MECRIDTHNAVTQRRAPRDGHVPKRIGIAIFNGFSLLDTVSIVEAFQAANRLAAGSQRDAPRYDVRLLSAGGGRIASSSSVFVWTDSVEARGYADDFHALFIAGGTGVHEASRDGRLLAWLRRAHLRSENILPIAEGRFLLEAAEFAPSVGSESAYGQVSRNHLRRGMEPTVQREVSSPLESALSLIEADLGTEITGKAAAWLTLRASTQFTPVLDRNTSGSVSEKIRASAQWLEANGDQPISIDKAAAIAAMSERNFLRRFKAEIGVTPSDYLLYVRLDMSCRLLLESALPVDKIARRCGFGDGGQLAKLFRKHVGATPTEYRSSKRQSHNC